MATIKVCDICSEKIETSLVVPYVKVIEPEKKVPVVEGKPETKIVPAKTEVKHKSVDICISCLNKKFNEKPELAEPLSKLIDLTK